MGVSLDWRAARQLEGLGAGDTRIGSILQLGLVSSSLCLIPGECPSSTYWPYQLQPVHPFLLSSTNTRKLLPTRPTRLLFVTHDKPTFQTVQHQSNQSLVARLFSTRHSLLLQVATSLPISDTHPPPTVRVQFDIASRLPSPSSALPLHL